MDNLIVYLTSNWWGSDARALGMALRRQGQLLTEVDQGDYLVQRWSALPLRLLRRVARFWLERDLNQAVLARAGAPCVGFLLVFKGTLLRAATLRALSEQGLACYCFYPDVSFLDHGAHIWSCLPFYDCVFTTKPFHVQDPALRKRVKDVRLVTHGYDPEVHRPVRVSPAAQKEYGCDVSFVGCWSPKKEAALAPIIAQCPDCDVRIWGPGWDRAQAAVRARWRGRGAYGDELALIYAASKINLGLLSEKGTGAIAGDQTTVRTWQAPAVGGFMLHEDTPELRAHFKPGLEVEVFADPDDLVRKVRAGLASDSLRRSMAEAGHRRCVSEGYTYDRAAREILSYHSKRLGQPLARAAKEL